MIKYVKVSRTFCDECEKDIRERDGCPSFHDKNGNVFCIECGVRHGLVDPLGYLEYHGWSIFHHAEITEGNIIGYQKRGKGFAKYIFPLKNGDIIGG